MLTIFGENMCGLLVNLKVMHIPLPFMRLRSSICSVGMKTGATTSTADLAKPSWSLVGVRKPPREGVITGTTVSITSKSNSKSKLDFGLSSRGLTGSFLILSSLSEVVRLSLSSLDDASDSSSEDLLFFSSDSDSEVSSSDEDPDSSELLVSLSEELDADTYNSLSLLLSCKRHLSFAHDKHRDTYRSFIFFKVFNGLYVPYIPRWCYFWERRKGFVTICPCIDVM